MHGTDWNRCATGCSRKSADTYLSKIHTLSPHPDRFKPSTPQFAPNRYAVHSFDLLRLTKVRCPSKSG